MRTGLIHLTGLAATLLLLLTLIAWVDSVSNITYASVVRNQMNLGVDSDRGQIEVFCQWIQDIRVDHGWSVGRDAHRAEFGVMDEFAEPVTWSAGPLVLTWNEREPGIGRKWEVTAPHWLLAVGMAIPALFYIRFLYRRRHPPASAPRSDEVDDAESLDGVSSHTS